MRVIRIMFIKEIHTVIKSISYSDDDKKTL